MKKIKILSVALITLFSLGVVFGKTIESSIIQKILEIKASTFFTKDLMAKVIDSQKTSAGQYQPNKNFDIMFYHARNDAFEAAFGGYDAAVKMDTTMDAYYKLRAITVARIKTELHSGDTLLNLYKDNQEAFLTAVTQTEPEQRELFKKFLVVARKTFEQAKDKKNQERFTAYTTTDNSPTWEVTHIMLDKNMTAEEIASQTAIQSTGKNIDETRKDFEKWFDDPRLAKFALRRWREGGLPLIDKYIDVIDLMIKDVDGL